mgnify:CR=1 FL=1
MGGADTNVWRRFIAERPISGATTAILAWCCAGLAAAGNTTLLLVWDNASWHLSKAVRQWLRAQNRTVKREGHVVRILACFLPSKSAWLNPIEPRWVPGKRRVAEPARLLSADELKRRVYAAFHAPRCDYLTITNDVA